MSFYFEHAGHFMSGNIAFVLLLAHCLDSIPSSVPPGWSKVSRLTHCKKGLRLPLWTSYNVMMVLLCRVVTCLEVVLKLEELVLVHI